MKGKGPRDKIVPISYLSELFPSNSTKGGEKKMVDVMNAKSSLCNIGSNRTPLTVLSFDSIDDVVKAVKAGYKPVITGHSGKDRILQKILKTA